jgi:Amt family ammonium transporter
MRKFVSLLFVLFALALPVLAADTAPAAAPVIAPAINAGDTAWILVSAALVMFMTPGLAFFYGGLVRKKNILGILMQCMIALAVISLQWVLFGYSLSFATGNGFIGNLQWAGLNGIGLSACPYAPTIPHVAFIVFQMMFAVITPALIAGAFAERMKFPAYLAFILLWATFVYDPVCHWVWGKGGWLNNMGVLDFAGGIVVHITAGFAALVTALYLGRRKSGTHFPTPHNLPFTVLGAALLWFGWFGFNAGSALAANAVSANAFLTTNIAAAAAALMWAILDWKLSGRPTILGTITGAVAGLATVTPASGFVNIWGAIAIGMTTTLICYFMVAYIKPKLKYDDTLDAFGVHGMGGLWGTLMAGVFAVSEVNGAKGLIQGNLHQLKVQALASVSTIAYTIAVTFVILKLIDMTIGVRVSEKNEVMGLDLTEHNERAYTLVD